MTAIIKGHVVINFCPPTLLREAPFLEPHEFKELLPDYEHTQELTLEFHISVEPQDVCEELFDISNNPARNEFRNILLPHTRSISVGDIVTVEGVNYLCTFDNWVAI